LRSSGAVRQARRGGYGKAADVARRHGSYGGESANAAPPTTGDEPMMTLTDHLPARTASTLLHALPGRNGWWAPRRASLRADQGIPDGVRWMWAAWQRPSPARPPCADALPAL
jgi:hypothetical protein